MVGRIGFLGRNLRMDRKQPARKVLQGEVHVGVGGRVGIETVRPRPQHVEVDHRVDQGRVREGTVQEIPRAGEGLGGSAEAHQQDRAAQQEVSRGQHPSQLHEHREAGSIAVGPVEDPVDAAAVDRHGADAEVVHPGTDHDVMVAKGLVRPLDESQHVARSQRVTVLLPQAENVA